MRDKWFILLVYAALSTASATTLDVELSPSYVATRQQTGDIELVLTVTANRHMAVGGAVATSIPLSQFLDQAAKKECPLGYTVKSQDSRRSETLLNVINWTQRSVIRCNGA